MNNETKQIQAEEWARLIINKIINNEYQLENIVDNVPIKSKILNNINEIKINDSLILDKKSIRNNRNIIEILENIFVNNVEDMLKISKQLLSNQELSYIYNKIHKIDYKRIDGKMKPYFK